MSDIEDNEKYSSSSDDEEEKEESVVSSVDEEEALDDEEDDYENPDEDEDEDEPGSDNDSATQPQLETMMGGGEGSDEEDDEEEEDDPLYLQKFNAELNKNYLAEAHPECIANNYDEIQILTKVVRDSQNNIIDPLHRTLPYLTKYERARVLGQRAKQINSGSKVFVKVPENIIDGHLIAEIELREKRIPFILRRPIPGGGCEYWNLKDLEIIGF
jgi:DNA-directed RNA polymerase I, II, and III subunit RPABC2